MVAGMDPVIGDGVVVKPRPALGWFTSDQQFFNCKAEANRHQVLLNLNNWLMENVHGDHDERMNIAQKMVDDAQTVIDVLQPITETRDAMAVDNS